jgi:hypothetical protein
MKYLSIVTSLLLLALSGAMPGRLLGAEGDSHCPAALMPRSEDYTHMWWAEGFPAHTPAAPWRRVVQTGHYALAFDTDTLRIPHFGPVSGDVGYLAAAGADNRAWQKLPAAELVLSITVDGKTYCGTAGGKWTQFTGPRLVESGRLVQRADVTDLVFQAADGARLAAETRFETVAWPDRLAWILAARPAKLPISAGEAAFGRVGGGFGFDGTNHLEEPHSPELEPGHFTLELWIYLAADSMPSGHAWLVGKNRNEWTEGNYGVMLAGGVPRVWLNIGGGRENCFHVASPHSLTAEQWHHLAATYDGEILQFYVNGSVVGSRTIGRARQPGSDNLVIGRRPDNAGGGYHFRGALDEIRLYDRVLAPSEIRQRFQAPETIVPDRQPVREWTFRRDGRAAAERPGPTWRTAAMEIRLSAEGSTLHQRWNLPEHETWESPQWREIALAFDPVAFRRVEPSRVTVAAHEFPAGRERQVTYETAGGWHRVDLDGIEPTVPPGEEPANRNDAIERVRLRLSNPTDCEQLARLLFAKTGRGIRQRLGAPITGMSAMLRDRDGNPIGIPVQLSKNWHHRPEGGVYAGTWFHGFSQVRLPPQAEVELELTIVYGHWGGVPAASHAQLCLIGWGSNQLWDQSALGAWGESICYEPDQVQARAAILDVRPVLVRSMHSDQPWQWTHNVGGGDYFRLFDPQGRRVPHARMRTAYQRHGPCLTEVTYAGCTGGGLVHSAAVSLARTDDIVRGVYRLRLDVTQQTDFSRFVLFQIGADTYSYTGERKMALGNETGLVREWTTQWGGDTYRTEPFEHTGRIPWVSLHAAASRSRDGKGAWANRGLVLRSWKARLGGQDARPWFAERGVQARGEDTSTIDLLPPPGIHRLLPGDFVEATIVHLVIPQTAADYYGPNDDLRVALEQGADTWRMVHREALGNDRTVAVIRGTLENRHPAIRIHATAQNQAEFSLSGGLGYVPVTFAGLNGYRRPYLEERFPGEDWRPVDQAVHGNDFWQTDYDPETTSWELTYTLPADWPEAARQYRFSLRDETGQ